MAQLPRTQFTQSNAPNPHARKKSQHKIFACPIGAAPPNAIYTQHAAEPACQEDINAKFSQLLLAQLPQTQFTHSTPPNPHARKTSTQNFRSSQLPQTIYTQHAAKPTCQQDINAKFSHLLLAQLPRTQFTQHAAKPACQEHINASYWHSYPKRNLHTARHQTRMPGTHQRKIFAAPIGTATPNAIYTQHAAKPACQQDINAKFSQLLLAQLPRTQFTHSKPQKQQRPARDLHTTRRQTRMPGRHHRKIFAPPIGPATPNAIYTQHAAKPACQEDINAKFSQLLLAQLPQTQFTHSTPPNPHAKKTSTQNFRSSHWPSYPKRNLHTARHQTRMPGTHQRKIFAAPIGAATPNAIYTQHAAKPARQQDINTKFSQLRLARLPRTQCTHSTPPNPHARNTSTQKFRSSHWHSYPKRNLHTARRQTRMPAER